MAAVAVPAPRPEGCVGRLAVAALAGRRRRADGRARAARAARVAAVSRRTRAAGRAAGARRRARARRVRRAQPDRPGRHRRPCSTSERRRPGRRLFQLTPEQVRVPFGVEVVQVTPPSIALTFENSATRVVPVVAGASRATPAPGFVVGTLIVGARRPSRSSGRRAPSTASTEAMTEPVSVAGATRDGRRDRDRRRRRSRRCGSRPRSRRRSPCEIVPGPRERTFARSPVHLRGLARGLAARADPVDRRRDRAAVARRRRHGRAPATSSPCVDLAGLGAGRVHADRARRRPRSLAVSSASSPATVQVRSPVTKRTTEPRSAAVRHRRRSRHGRRVSARPRHRSAARRGARARAAAPWPRGRSCSIGRDTRESGEWIERGAGARRRRRGRDASRASASCRRRPSPT